MVDLAAAIVRVGDLDPQRVRVDVAGLHRSEPVDDHLAHAAFAAGGFGFEDRRVNGGSLSDRLFRVDIARRGAAGDFGQHLFDDWHVRRTADENQVIQAVRADARLLQHQLGGVSRPLQQVRCDPLEVAARHRDRQRVPFAVHGDLRLSFLR